ncbi:hypothetical protein BCR32DRAFT_324060 [Anaeromyces robustus]|uniref:Uncharacterized protein n=1 Tax=Anaeromyces robustus TaxID=1754192 RepID=A0A1Y1XRZ9_9FUNG|nr:hypothetical protein BCR32DRAFT_324060 [Anaeromyces robustus]|eukprot:ORX88266.1 hypothetical protein BCR32DRAFT_324060 [Anaeromyces robustus]
MSNEINCSKNPKIDDNLDSDLNIITSHSFNEYSVSSGLNKIKFLKNLKEEISKQESTNSVNTHSSNNVQKSDILITEDLDSLIKGVQNMPVIPKLEKLRPMINKQYSNKRDDSTINRKKKKNKRKRKNNNYNKDYLDEDDDRSQKLRKVNIFTKNWDDITIEESEYFDVEDKENSFESILNQYNSMKQLPKDILVINKILNEPTDKTNNNNTSELSLNAENKLYSITVDENKSMEIVDKSNTKNILMSKVENSDINKLNENNNKTINIEPSEVLKLNKEQKDNIASNNDENDDNSSIGFNEISHKLDFKANEDSIDIWNKNSPSSNVSVSNMSDEEINYSNFVHRKKHKLENLRYNSILTPPTPPQPLEEN